VATLTSQAKLKEGLVIIDEELAPSSSGKVSEQGFHVPDVDLVDAKNTLPTIHGYTSFFGKDDKLEGTALVGDIQEQITYKTIHGDVIQIAFASTGIWIRALAGDAVGTTKAILTTGITKVNSIPTNGGAGYAVSDVLTLTEGAGGTVTVTAVAAGVITAVALTTNGTGYTTGTGKVTSGGSGAGATIEIISVATFDYDELNFLSKKCKWTKILTTIPLSPWKMWTYTLMQNALYVFQKGMTYIGKITSYKTGQVIFEHLDPTYILANRKRHVFTYTSEDDSTGDDTYKAINITTNTGLDFGEQRIAVDTATDVALAIDSWKAILESTGFFATEFTETFREEIPIDAVISLNVATAADVQAIIDATVHDGIDAELKLEVIWET
jgi:hypothetical protein